MRIASMLNDIFVSLFKRPATELYPYTVRPAPSRLRGKLLWDESKCDGCKLCVRDCPAKAIEIEVIDRAARKVAYHYHLDRCIYCAHAWQAVLKAPSPCRVSCTIWLRRTEQPSRRSTTAPEKVLALKRARRSKSSPPISKGAQDTTEGGRCKAQRYCGPPRRASEWPVSPGGCWDFSLLQYDCPVVGGLSFEVLQRTAAWKKRKCTGPLSHFGSTLPFSSRKSPTG